MQQALFILFSVIFTLLFCAAMLALYVKRNTVATFRFDSTKSSPLCTFELERLPESFERKRYVVVRVARADLSLPGTPKSQ